MRKIDTYVKALVGAIIAGLGAIQTGLSDGHLTAQEYVTSAIAAATALGLVYAVPNAGSSAPSAGAGTGGTTTTTTGNG